MPSQSANAIRLGVFFLAQAVRFTGERIKPSGGLLLLRAAHQACRLAKLVSRLPRSFSTLLLPGAPLHLFARLAQPIQGLSHTRIARTSISI